jgi:hypothetical protein
MLSLFKKDNPPQSPLKDHRLQWVESAFQWLTDTFDRESILARKVLIPHHSDFPIRYNGNPQTATDTLAILAAQMDIAFPDIQLTIDDDTINQLSTGSPTGSKLILITDTDPSFENDPDADIALSHDHGLSAANDQSPGPGQPAANDQSPGPGQRAADWPSRNEEGKYPVTLNKSRLQVPEIMVAALARELAKIKLLGENRIPKPDEPLADLTTLIFGLGIFNANASFLSQNIRIAGTNSRMTQMEWGYGLALFAHLRNEKRPPWIDYLVKNIKSDFLKSEQYIAYNHRQ